MPGQRIGAQPTPEAATPDVVEPAVPLNFKDKTGLVLPGDKFDGVVTGKYREELIEKLSQWMSIKILRIIKVSGSEPSYTLELDNGKIHIESISKLLDSTHVRSRIAAVTGMLIRRFKAVDWDVISSTILACAEVWDAGPEMETEGEMIAILQQYLSSRPWLGAMKSTVNESRLPMIKGNAIAVNTSDIYMYMMREFNSRMTIRQIATALVALHAESYRTRIAGVDQSRWLLPLSLFQPQDFAKNLTQENPQ